MLAADPAPGVRFELADPPRSVPDTRTDVAGFVGFAERGPLHAPVRVESWTQYEAAFGSFQGGGYLPYAVHAFFENGGRTAHVVRVAVPEDDSDVPWERRARAAWADLPLRGPAIDGADPWVRVTARSPGRWGNGIRVDAAPAGGSTADSPRLTMLVTDRAGTTWRLADTSLDPADPRYLPAVAAATARLPVHVQVLAAPPEEGTREDRAASLPAARTVRRQLRGGRDGTSACTLRHLLGGGVEPQARWGLATLLHVDEVALVAIPDAGAFPARAPDAPLPVDEIPCSVLEPPPPAADALPPRDTPWTVDEAAAWLGTTGARLREANPGVRDPVPPGAVLRVPAPRHARRDDQRVDEPERYWRPGTGRDAVRRGLPRLAADFGVTLWELLEANPAYRPALGPDPAWTPPDAPLVIPEPPAEAPPAWSWEDSCEAARALIAFCEARRDCVALLDPPATAGTAPEVERFRAGLPDTPAAGLYWPWLLAERAPRAGGPARLPGTRGVPASRRGETLAVPPCGFVAGLTAAADLAVGPHRSPAGQTARHALAVAVDVDEGVHGRLNARGINAFRERPARGVVLEGTRSLAPYGPWRWLNVRRVFLAIAEDLEERTAWAVFEPGGPVLWAALRDQVRAYLNRRWRRGWLMGNEPDDAFYVRCDAETNPPEERDAGRVIAYIGLRIPPPAEWIEVRIGRSSLGLEILDVSRAA